jgi:hypothetical protein
MRWSAEMTRDRDWSRRQPEQLMEGGDTTPQSFDM